MVERRHCQQAASNDARVYPALLLDEGASARAHCGDHFASDAQVRRVIGPRGAAQAQGIIAAVKSCGDEAKGACAPWTRGAATRALSGHELRFKIGRTQRAGNDRNACSLADGAGQGAFTEEL